MDLVTILTVTNLLFVMVKNVIKYNSNGHTTPLLTVVIEFVIVITVTNNKLEQLKLLVNVIVMLMWFHF